MKHKKGFTLVDALVALAIGSILLGIAIPSFQQLWAKHQSRVVMMELAHLINFARITSVSKGQTVALCPISDNQECGSDWAQGAMVFVDPNRNGKKEENDTVLRVLDEFPDGIQLTWRSFGGKSTLRFSPTGSTFLGNGTFNYCPADGDAQYANQIVVNYTGRLRFAQDSNDDGFKENSEGDNLTCEG